MNTIGREIAWRRVVRQWQYSLTHLPAEQNDEADALSRLEAEPKRDMPQLGEAVFVAPPKQDEALWKARLDFSQEKCKPVRPKQIRSQLYKRVGRGVQGAWPL